MASTYKHSEQLEQLLPERIKLNWTFGILAIHFRIDLAYHEIYESKLKNAPDRKTAIVRWIEEINESVKLDSEMSKYEFYSQNPSIKVYYDTLDGDNITLNDYSFEVVEAYEKIDNAQTDIEGWQRVDYEYRNSSMAKFKFPFHAETNEPFFIKYIKNLASAAYTAHYIFDLQKELAELENPSSKPVEIENQAIKPTKEAKKIIVKCGPAEFTDLMKMLQAKGWIELPPKGETTANSLLKVFDFAYNNPSKDSLGRLFASDTRIVKSLEKHEILSKIPLLATYNNTK